MAEENKIEVELSIIDNMSSEISAIRANMEKNLERQGDALKKNKAEVKGLGDELKGNFVNAIKGAVLAYAGMQGIRTITNFFMQARKEFQEGVASQVKLAQAIGYTSQALQEQADALAQKIMIDDDEVRSVQSMLANNIKFADQLEMLTPAVLDLAAGMKIDLESAAQLVSRAVSDDGSELGKLKITIDGVRGSQERASSVFDGINAKYHGQAEAAVAAKDGIDKLALSWKELLKAVGSTESVKNSQNTISAFLSFWADGIKNNIKYSQITKQLLLDAKQAETEGITAEQVRQNRLITENIKKIDAEAQSERDRQKQLDIDNKKENLDRAKKATEDYKNEIIKRKEIEAKQYEENVSYKDTKTGKVVQGGFGGIAAQAISESQALDQKFNAERDAETRRLEMLKKNGEEEIKLKKEIADIEVKINQNKIDQEAASTEIARKNREQAKADAVNNLQMAGSLFSAIAGANKRNAQEKKNIARVEAGINTAVAVTKALPNPAMVAFALAMGIAQQVAITNAKFATGTPYAPGGMALVGENGPEMMSIPRGAQIYNSSQTKNMTTNQGSMTINVMDQSGSIVESMRRDIRSGAADQLVRDIITKAGRSL